jgi:hypothetical protein
VRCRDPDDGRRLPTDPAGRTAAFCVEMTRWRFTTATDTAPMCTPACCVLLLLAAALPQAPSASPTVADPSDGSHTVCAVRKLAYERAMERQPHNTPHRKLFDALQLHTLCGEAQPPPAAEVNLPLLRRQEQQQQQQQHGIGGFERRGDDTAALHVDPLTGDDVSGRPFRTVGAAVRAARRGGGRTKSLVLADGIHFLNETLTLTPADSGFRISAASGSKPGSVWLSGGVPLSGLTWRREAHGIWATTIADPTIEDIPGLLAVGEVDHAPSSRFVR